MWNVVYFLGILVFFFEFEGRSGGFLGRMERLVIIFMLEGGIGESCKYIRDIVCLL